MYLAVNVPNMDGKERYWWGIWKTAVHTHALLLTRKGRFYQPVPESQFFVVSTVTTGKHFRLGELWSGEHHTRLKGPCSLSLPNTWSFCSTSTEARQRRGTLRCFSATKVCELFAVTQNSLRKPRNYRLRSSVLIFVLVTESSGICSNTDSISVLLSCHETAPNLCHKTINTGAVSIHPKSGSLYPLVKEIGSVKEQVVA